MKPRSLARMPFFCLIACAILAVWLGPQQAPWSPSASFAGPNYPSLDGEGFQGLPTGGPDDDDEADTEPPPDDTGGPVGALSLTNRTPNRPAPIQHGNG